MSKYPELANASAWTPRMKYIHRRAMILGLVLGMMLGSTVTVLAIILKIVLDGLS